MPATILPAADSFTGAAVTEGQFKTAITDLRAYLAFLFGVDGTKETAWTTLGAGFPTGTRMLFQQTAAPVGWTKDTSAGLDNSALRIVTGTAGNGGATAFTTVFGAGKSTDGFTLTTAHMPSHSHYEQMTNSATGLPTRAKYVLGAWANEPFALVQTEWTNTGKADLSTEAAGSGGSHAHSFGNFDLKYRDVIVASKD